MSEAPRPGPAAKPPRPKDEREERLKAALRKNLRRRKDAEEHS